MKNKNIYAKCFLRFFNTIPSNESFDIYVDDKLLKTDILYKDFSVYEAIPEGKHNVALTLNGDSTITTSRDIYIRHGQIYTLIIGVNSKTLFPTLYYIEDVRKKIPKETCLVRTANFCGSREVLKLNFSEDPRPFKKILPLGTTHYIAFAPGNFTASSTYLSTKEDFLSDISYTFKQYRIYTIYILGDGSSNYPFELLLSIDGSSFLNLEPPNN